MKILTIIGARPQFIKCAPVSAALRQKHDEFIVHTGQHYDANMSQIFFEEMGIPKPNANLEVGSGSHAQQTAAMMIGLEPLMLEYGPDAVLIYGDTNSTIAGALVAAKLNIPIVHVEAGLRSFNLEMPEEINRIVADQLSKVLCCPTQTAIDHLAKEGIIDGVVNTGDVMYDALLYFKPLSEKSNIFERLEVVGQKYSVMTLHRASNTDKLENLVKILEAIQTSEYPVYFPVHPRTRAKFKRENYDLSSYSKIRFIDPLGYLDFMALVGKAQRIITDSGGLQKEAYWHGVPCITVREETEWTETVESGWNCIVGTDSEKIKDAISNFRPSGARPSYYGEGQASAKILESLKQLKS